MRAFSGRVADARRLQVVAATCPGLAWTNASNRSFATSIMNFSVSAEESVAAANKRSRVGAMVLSVSQLAHALPLSPTTVHIKQIIRVWLSTVGPVPTMERRNTGYSKSGDHRYGRGQGTQQAPKPKYGQGQRTYESQWKQQN